MTDRITLRQTILVTLSALVLAACSGGDAPEVSPPEAIETTAEQPTPDAAEATTEPVAEAPAGLAATWESYPEEERQSLCTSIGIIGEDAWMESMSDSAAASPEEHRDFLRSACADVDVSESMVVDTMEATWEGYSETRRGEACSDLDTMGEAAILTSWRSELGLVEETPYIDGVILDLWSSKCAEYESATAASSDSEDWVRGSEDAWFTEAAIHSIWSNVDKDTREQLCGQIDVLGVEYMAHKFATDVLEPTWSLDQYALDIQAVEETLTEICS